MKKISFMAAVVAMAAFVSGCGTMGSTGTSTTQSTSTPTAVGTTQSSGNLLTSVLSSSGTSVVGTLLSTILGNTTSKNTIVGTWTYSAPKVTFKSESILAQVGSSLASSKIESMLGTQLGKMGFQEGKTTIVFNSDGSCQVTRSGKTIPGTYTYNQSTGVMTIQGALGLTSVSPYVSVMGNEMYMLFDADKLMSIMKTIGSASGSSTISSLLGNYNGIQLGWTMTRK